MIPLSTRGTEFADNLVTLSLSVPRKPYADKPEPARYWPKPRDVDIFMQGGCGVFALVLNYFTNWPIVYFLCSSSDCGRNPESKLKLGHVALINPSRMMVVDSYGHRTKAMMVRNFDVQLFGPVPANKKSLLKDLREGSRIGPYEEKTFDLVKNTILGHWGLYGYNWFYPADISSIRLNNVLGVDAP